MEDELLDVFKAMKLHLTFRGVKGDNIDNVEDYLRSRKLSNEQLQKLSIHIEHNINNSKGVLSLVTLILSLLVTLISILYGSIMGSLMGSVGSTLLSVIQDPTKQQAAKTLKDTFNQMLDFTFTTMFSLFIFLIFAIYYWSIYNRNNVEKLKIYQYVVKKIMHEEAPKTSHSI